MIDINISVIIIYISVFAILLYFLFSWLNRGKRQLKNLILTIIYSVIIGCIVFTSSLAKKKPDPVLYFTILGILTAYPVFLVILDVIKRRQSVVAPMLFVLGLILAVITPYLPEKINIISSVTSVIIFACFFLYLRNYPHLNFMWLEDAVIRSAKLAQKPCKYSSKPVVIFKDFNKRWVSRIRGLLLLIKKDRVIIRINKKLFDRLGCPNLMEFGNRLTDIIMEKTNKREKNKSTKQEEYK